VRNEQRRRPCHKLGELVVEAGARDRIKCRERFVEQQERRLSHQCARQRHAPTFTTRDLSRIPIQQPTRANALERRLSGRSSAQKRLARQLQGERHIA